MGAPVVRSEVGATDADAAGCFYSALSGWSVNLDRTGYGVVDTGGNAGIQGGMVQTPEGVPPWVTFYVRVDDLEVVLGRADKLGAHRLTGPMPVGDVGETAMFADPDGNMPAGWAEGSRNRQR
ncbi:VOC family protein [Pseudonocardia sp. N23]|uniref:VOC family protein n=1 Tax=Pseudonocardia sp. N23 TaxID=1987376 RepID=UPI000BFC1233|nr:VOC family protein [Pseudonocardia sp. N23]GAY07368.1 hypothetical protein TOK_2593 [Pseudonocardia sp. N23]